MYRHVFQTVLFLSDNDQNLLKQKGHLPDKDLNISLETIQLDYFSVPPLSLSLYALSQFSTPHPFQYFVYPQHPILCTGSHPPVQVTTDPPSMGQSESTCFPPPAKTLYPGFAFRPQACTDHWFYLFPQASPQFHPY